MTETTREIFETYQIRKSNKQRKAFRDYVIGKANEYGFSYKTEKSLLGAENIIIGDINSAKVVYTAHYDTCARLPFPNFITPKNFFVYLLYQLLIVVVFFAFSFAIGFLNGILAALLNLSDSAIFFLILATYWIFILLLFAGPANKHTANDNTSGVTVLLDIMTALPDEDKEKVAFIFFDLEESGLIGSSFFARKHKKAMKNKLLINFDCVSDGEHILFALRKKSKQYKDAISQAFNDNGNLTVEVATKGVFYPSDQMNFPCGVGVAGLKKSKFSGTLYMNRIHTKKDTVYREENIEFLKNGSLKLIKLV